VENKEGVCIRYVYDGASFTIKIFLPTDDNGIAGDVNVCSSREQKLWAKVMEALHEKGTTDLPLCNHESMFRLRFNCYLTRYGKDVSDLVKLAQVAFNGIMYRKDNRVKTACVEKHLVFKEEDERMEIIFSKMDAKWCHYDDEE